MEFALAIAIAYLVGSVPFAFLLTRRSGIDLREVGSGNVGAANVLRTSGVSPAILVMLLDMSKGAAAVLAAQAMTEDIVAPVAAGLASIVGHMYPVWLGFRGGKGVATAAGAFGVLAPLTVSIAALVFVVTIYVTRFVSAGSLLAAAALAIAAPATKAPHVVVLGACGAALIIAYRHWSNVRRLVSGTERRIGLRLFDRRG